MSCHTLGPESLTLFEVPSRLSGPVTHGVTNGYTIEYESMTWSVVLLSVLGRTKLTNPIHKA